MRTLLTHSTLGSLLRVLARPAALALAVGACGGSAGTSGGTSAGTSGGTSAGASTGASGGSSGGGTRPTCDTPADGASPSHVVIESDADLAQLDGISVVSGDLWVNRSNLKDLDALICITEVQGNLKIFGNTELTSVAGLDNLATIGGSVTVSENPSLTVFDTANAVTRVDDFSMNNNDALTAITGFDALEDVGGFFVIQYNVELTDISGLYGLKTVGEAFQVTQNHKLCLSEVNKIGEGLSSPPGDLPGSSTAGNDDSC